MAFTDHQKFEHYQDLSRAINTIVTQRITEDWMEEHKQKIRLYRDYFFDLSLINAEVKDKTFRRVAWEAELMLKHLDEEVTRDKTFTTRLYLSLNQHLVYIVEYFLEKDELEEILSRMTI